MDDLSDKFYKDIMFQDLELKTNTINNNIKQIGIIIMGLTGSGKTTLAKNIVKGITDYYGIGNCATLYTNSLPLGLFLDKALEQSPKPVQILVYDDATTVRVNSKDQRTFFSLRHLMESKTGLKNGVIYTIYITHDWYSLDRIFRRNALFTIFISVPMLDKYSRNEYKRFIGEKPLNELSEMTFECIKHNDKKGKGIIILPVNNVGYFYWKNINVPYTELKLDTEEVK